ncbi:uncharacterized protein LOC117647626 [Thrips palmi]|uniref:Uncharacterized protein LOC117647626 n=1 Tax=Thrips palmi TaxID=161013 RepID=A0A6P8Z651_THRPL|nr:uncharacterized protein LOC117647626 [Thrips palmi]
MDYMDRRRRLHPRLAMMAALLDDWSLPFTRNAATQGRRGSGLTFPKWLLDDGEEDADDSPVLRRSRSTWATWPSMDEDSGRTKWLLDDEPWWTTSAQRREHREQHPRDQEELRAARRRYFEPRHGRRQDHDDADDDRRVSFREVPIRTSGQDHDDDFRRRDAPARDAVFIREVPVNRNSAARVSFHDDRAAVEEPASPMHARVQDFLRRGASAGRDVPARDADATRTFTREVPIAVGTDRSEDSGITTRTTFGTRAVPTSLVTDSGGEPKGVPLKRDNTVIEVVPAKTAPVTRDIPITRDVFVTPASRDNPVTRDAFVTPASRDIPVTRDAFVTPASRDNPVTRDAFVTPASRDIPVTRDTPVTRDMPASRGVWDIPVTMDSTFSRDATPNRKGGSVTRDIPVARDVPDTKDIPVTRTVPITMDDTIPDSPVTRDIPVTLDAFQPSTATSTATEGAWSGQADDDTETEDVEQDGTMVPQHQLRREQKRCLHLQDENLRLKAVITTIQETNKRWQGFNAARQAYIERLLSTIEEQQVQLNACLDALKTSSPKLAAKPAPPAPAAPGNAAPAAPTNAAPAAPTDTAPAAPDVMNAEGRLKRLQGEVSDLQRRLQEAKKEHRDTVCMLQQVSNQPAAPARSDHGVEETPPPKESAHPEQNKLSEDSAARLRGTTSPRPRSPAAPHRPCYYDVVTDNPASPASPATTTPFFAERERERTQYSFNGDALHKHLQQRRGVSPALSDALTPTPTPPPQHQRPEEQHADGYPVELSGSYSSLCSYSGPAPHVSVPSSSRATTPDQDVSMCSDATLDCSPPSPVQGTLTVGFTGAGLASITAFHVRPSAPSPAPTPSSPSQPLGAVHVLARASSRGGCASSSSEEDSGRGGTTTSTTCWREDVWEGAVGAVQHSRSASRQDVTCPACGRVFPPALQATFMAHFEACALQPLQQPPRTTAAPPSPRTRRSCRVPD